MSSHATEKHKIFHIISISFLKLALKKFIKPMFYKTKT